MRRRVLTVALALATVLGLLPAAASAAFPGRNGRLAFVESFPGSNEGISTSLADGTRKTRLYRGGVSPVWSANGTRIAFKDGQGLGTIGATGAGYRHIDLPPNMSADHPTWSPGGRWIAFTGYTSDPSSEENEILDTAIWKIRADGTGLRRLRVGIDPSWSPRGGRIAYVSGAQETEHSWAGCTGLYVMGENGGSRRQISRTEACRLGNVAGNSPDFSPGGSRIIYVRPSRKPSGSKTFEDVYTIGLDGRGERRLTATDSGQEAEPTYSPDGRFIAYGAYCGCRSQAGLFISRADGSGRRRLREDIRRVSWQPLR